MRGAFPSLDRAMSAHEARQTRRSAIQEERQRIRRALPIAPESPLPPEYARGWWDAMSLCLDAIDPDHPRMVVLP